MATHLPALRSSSPLISTLPDFASRLITCPGPIRRSVPPPFTVIVSGCPATAFAGTCTSAARAQSAANQQTITTRMMKISVRMALLRAVQAVLVYGHAIAVHIRRQIITQRHREGLRDDLAANEIG